VLAVVAPNNAFAATNGVHERQRTQLIPLLPTELDLALELSYSFVFLLSRFMKKKGAVSLDFTLKRQN
jgi:hypothetical protein